MAMVDGLRLDDCSYYSLKTQTMSCFSRGLPLTFWWPDPTHPGVDWPGSRETLHPPQMSGLANLNGLDG